MDEQFIRRLSSQHQKLAQKHFPASDKVCLFADELIGYLFPEFAGYSQEPSALEAKFADLHQQILSLLSPMQLLKKPAALLANEFMDSIPHIYDFLNQDAEALLEGDPAATCRYEVIRTYPGFFAIALYRIAHRMCQLKIPMLPRLITEHAHARTGIDIHPGAQIAPFFCIDHGTGVVIGETTVIGRGVKIYQGVTLGALSVSKEMAKSKRHPTIEDNVIIYAQATILGGETVVGHDSIIGGNVWLTHSVPAYSRIYFKADGSFSVMENKII